MPCCSPSCFKFFSGSSDYCAKESINETDSRQRGDMLRGVMRLGRNEAYKLYKMIRNFLDEHEQKGRKGSCGKTSLSPVL